MSFDDIPEDKEESHPCPSCGGSVHISADRTVWYCEDCEWQAEDLGD